ncbi:MAG: hypothetical protein IPL61_26990 [Myxococcales bacterium]|nr:hypothetical protein [Myxococcales bacterium]
MAATLRWLLALAVLPGACGDASSAPDAAVIADDAAGLDAGLPATCAGACRTTALTARFGAAVRTLDHAIYGVTIATGAPPTLYVEIHRGGAAGCPTMTSPTPDYTLILGAVPVPTTTAPTTTPGNLLDFRGDLLGGPLGAAATAVTVTPVAADVCPSCVGAPAPSHPDGLIALDVDLTFAAGTVVGHLFASHCDGLDTAP